MKKIVVEFIFPVAIEYENEMDLRDAIKHVKEIKHGMISAGSTNFEYNTKRPRILQCMEEYNGKAK